MSQEPDADGANPVFGFVAVSEPLGAQRLAGLHPWWRQGHTGRASGPSQHGDAVPAASAAVARWVSISEQQAASAAVPTVRAGAVVSWVRCPRVSAPERVDGIGEGPTRTRNRSGPGANRPRWPKATSTLAGSVKSLSFPRCGGESRPRVSAGGAALGNRLGHRPAAALRGRPSRARSRPAAGISQTCHCPARRAPKPRRRRLRGVIRPPGDVTASVAVHGSAARLSGWRDRGCERSLRVGSDGPAGPLHRLVETPCGLPASPAGRTTARLGRSRFSGLSQPSGCGGRLRPQAADGTVTGGLLRRTWVAAAAHFCGRWWPPGRLPDHRYRIEYLVPTCAGEVCFIGVAEYFVCPLRLGLSRVAQRRQ